MLRVISQLLSTPVKFINPREDPDIGSLFGLTTHHHRCPEAKTQFSEMFNGSVNRVLVHFGHILWNCKA